MTYIYPCCNIYHPLVENARAEYDGQEYSGFAVTGYRFTRNCFQITPFASLLYSHLHIEDYTETGADSLNLHIDDQDYDFVESGLGLKVAYPFRTDCGIYIPELHTIWTHDFQKHTLDVEASFTGLGAEAGSFRNKGPRADQNTWNIGGSITCLATNNFSIQFVYDYEKSDSYFDHQGIVELSLDF